MTDPNEIIRNSIAYNTAFEEFHRQYEGFVKAGFTKEQALLIIAHTYAECVRSALNSKRKEKKGRRINEH